MTDPRSDHPSGFATLAELRQRLSSSGGTATLNLTADNDTNEIEAFLIAVLDATGNTHSCREQDALIRTVVVRADEDETLYCSGCGIEIRLTRHRCEIRHHLATLPEDLVSSEMLRTLVELDDPAGMVLAGMARPWDSPSISMTNRLTAAPQLH